MKLKLVLSIVATMFFLCLSTPLRAETTVMRLMVVHADNPDAYIQEMAKGLAHMKRLESAGKLHIWKTKFAGRDAGNIVVTVEFPSLAALAKDDEKLYADPEFRAWVKGLDKIRKIVSDSLYNESTP